MKYPVTWITLLLVKDKDNLVSHNQWSAGEYLNNVTGFSQTMGGSLSVTDEYKTIGHKSIKSTMRGGTASLDMVYVVSSDQIGKPGMASLDVYSESSFTTYLCFREGGSSGSAVIKSAIGVPGDENTHIIFTVPEVLSTTYSIFVRLLSRNDNVFADNFVLKLD